MHLAHIESNDVVGLLCLTGIATGSSAQSGNDQWAVLPTDFTSPNFCWHYYISSLKFASTLILTKTLVLEEMMTPVFKKQLQLLTDLLCDPNQLDACTKEVRSILDAKLTSCGQSEGSCCFASNPDTSVYSEVHLLERALKRDGATAASVLRDHLASTE